MGAPVRVRAAVAVVTGALAWQRRDRTPAATALAVTMVGVATWSAASGLLAVTTSEVVRQAYPAVLLASVGVVVAGMYVLARAVVDPAWRVDRRTVTLLALEPVTMIVLAALPATRELLISGEAPVGAADQQQVTLGPVFAVHTVYSYALVSVAYLRLARRWWTAAGAFRRQIGVLLAGGIVSTAGNVTTIAMQLDGQGADLTPLFFLVTGLIHCWAVLRLGLLQLMPIAREQVLDTVSDAVLVVDPSEVLLDLNPAFRRLLDRLRPELGGRS